ncbi:armadillo-like helical domain-containing protein [Tieghemostelium lacteum]|uniref:Exportin-T n=1 Tax=Tieghemostelium lacteum TaxID=361077 RepID=A0A151Z9K7_TIELA|nr:armadillo-like helical domain-containing protein [Tieghemostelium lacteum]|eukprot:KYQ90623.1 armadillo-like helical domain-containing protein [Tieghemostelium lacteum]
MDEFEKAIIYTFDPSVSEEIKQKALNYTDSIKNSPDAWKFCLDKLASTNSIHVKFFCFHIFQDLILYKHGSLNEQDRQKLKAGLIQWYKQHLLIQNEDAAIKNKYAQVVVLLFKQEYPDQWPEFFDEFLGTLNSGPLSIDMFLRILKSIDEEVVSFDVYRSQTELAQNTFIKDTLRDRAIVRIVKAWYDILAHYQQVSPTLINMTLQNIKYYVGWIDINLIVNDQFIPIFWKILNSRALREEVCECFKEIINKGMDPSAKLSLIKQLQITALVNYAQLDEIEFVVKFGNLINLTGMEIIRGMETLQTKPNSGTGVSPSLVVTPMTIQEIDQLLDEILDLFFKFFNNESDEVSYSVYGFAGLYINKLKNLKQPLTDKQIQHITMMVQIVRNKMRFHKDSLNEKLEEDNKFLEYRKDLSNIFRNIFRICPEMVGSFIQQSLTTIVQQQQQNNSSSTTSTTTKTSLSTNFADIEVSIYLLFQLGESIGGFTGSGAEEKQQQFEKFFAQMIILLAQSQIAQTEHQVVSLIYFETMVRYTKYIPQQSGEYQQYLGQILSAFLDKRGIHNRDPVVRKHAGYNLNKLVKQHKVQFFPFTNAIIESIKNHLIISFDIQKEVPFEEQLNFYELLGVLIGVSNLPPQEEQRYLDTILRDAMLRLEEITKKSLYKSDSKEQPFFTTQLYQLIMVIGTFSKGFSAFTPTGQPKPEASCQYKKYFLSALEHIIQLPHQLPVLNDEIKAKTFVYMHRMVECLGKDLIPNLLQIITILLAQVEKTESLQELILFINQCSAKFKEDMVQPLIEFLQPVVLRVFKSLNPPQTPMAHSDEERAISDLKKAYYQFIYQTLLNNLSAVFIAPRNLSSTFEQILSTLSQGCFSQSESIQKTSFQAIKKMIDDYSPGGLHPLAGFTKFIYDQIIPMFFQVLLSEQFAEFTTNTILGEVVKSLRALTLKVGDEFSSYLVMFLPTISMQPDQIQQFIKLLSPQAQQKEFHEYLKNFIKLKKSQNIVLNNQNNQNNNNNNQINNNNITSSLISQSNLNGNLNGNHLGVNGH